MCSTGTASGRFIDRMNRRPSPRSWLRTAQRWYSSAECAADGIWIAWRRWPMVSEKSSEASHSAPARLRTNASSSAASWRVSTRSGQNGNW